MAQLYIILYYMVYSFIIYFTKLIVFGLILSGHSSGGPTISIPSRPDPPSVHCWKSS